MPMVLSLFSISIAPSRSAVVHDLVPRPAPRQASDMSQLDPLFAPLTIGHVTIRNRFLSTSHAPGYAVHGDITDRYVAYEAEKAKGGVGLVQFGGATAVSVENSFHY